MAVTGSSLEAIIAGMIPESIPITEDTVIPKKILSKVSRITKVSVERKDSSETSIKPIAPPKKLRKTASKRNCKRIKEFFAPRDF